MKINPLKEGALIENSAGIGIPKNSILKYESALKTDKFVLVANGFTDEVTHAKKILIGTGAETLDHHREMRQQPAMQTA